jgi:hypothetical protein
MKIAITGNTKGLGNELSKRFDNVVGFTRSNLPIKFVDKIISASSDCDVFINNAFDGFNQTKLLMALYDEWKDTDKIIVNIVSRSKYPNISKGFMYSASKASLSHLSNSLRLIGDKKCRIIDINAGLLNSKIPSLSYIELADIIIWCINQPSHIEVGEISVWHNTPYQKISQMKDELK